MAIRGLATAGPSSQSTGARHKPPRTRTNTMRLEVGSLRALLAALILLAPPLASAQAPPAGPPAPPPGPSAPPAGPPAAVTLPPVTVIDSTPVPALGTPIEKYAGNVQTITSGQIENQNLLDVPDMLYRNFGSVNVNGNQGNPWQNDLTYRGFLASPLAGSPIGLSMYVDGMRFNDGFGE